MRKPNYAITPHWLIVLHKALGGLQDVLGCNMEVQKASRSPAPQRRVIRLALQGCLCVYVCVSVVVPLYFGGASADPSQWPLCKDR